MLDVVSRPSHEGQCGRRARHISSDNQLLHTHDNGIATKPHPPRTGAMSHRRGPKRASTREQLVARGALARQVLHAGHLLTASPGENSSGWVARLLQAIALTRTRATGFSTSSPRALLVRS